MSPIVPWLRPWQELSAVFLAARRAGEQQASGWGQEGPGSTPQRAGNSPVLESDNCAEGRPRGSRPLSPVCTQFMCQDTQFPSYRQRGDMTPLGVSQIWQLRAQIWEPGA